LKTSSIFRPVFAEVSIYSKPYSDATFYASSSVTTLFKVLSHLLPTINKRRLLLSRYSWLNISIYSSKSSKDFLLVTSITRKAKAGLSEDPVKLNSIFDGTLSLIKRFIVFSPYFIPFFV
jgi:hypothetical protein